MVTQQPSRTRSATVERTIPSREGTGVLPLISRPSPGQATAGVGGLPVKGELFPPMRSQSQLQRDIQARPAKKAIIKGGKMVISYPKVNEDVDDRHPLKRIPTVDLKTAAQIDRDRRINNLSETGSVTVPNTALEQSDPKELRNVSLRRKQVPRADSKSSKLGSQHLLDPIPERPSQGTSSAAEPAMGIEDVRRRSPRHISQEFQPPPPPAIPAKSESRSARNSFTSTENIGTAVPMQPPPRSPFRPQVPGTPPAMENQPSQKPHGPSKLAAEPTLVHYERKDSLPSNQRQLQSKTSVEVLVPPVPPLSPTDANIQTPYSWNETLVGPSSFPDSVSSIPRSRSVKNSIRPSRQRPTSPSTKDDTKPVKPAVQLRPTTGLPNNPRAQYSGTSTGSTGTGQDRTVMFVNRTDSGDSATFRDIMEDMLNKQPPTGTKTDLYGRDSVVNRPRPIPRKSVGETRITGKDLPSLPTPDPSSPRAVLKYGRSFMQSAAGSSNDLPPVPAMPPNIGSGPQPSATEVAGSSANLPQPSSKSTSNNADAVELDDTRVSTASKPTPALSNLQSFRQPPEHKPEQESFAFDQANDNFSPPALPFHDEPSRYISKFSVATTMSPYDGPPSSAIPSPALALLRSSQEGLRRKSSPVLPLSDSQESATPASIRMQLERPLTSGSRGLLSAGSVKSARGFSIVEPPKGLLGLSDRTTKVSVVDSIADEDDGRETVMLMLDPSTDHPTVKKAQVAAWHTDRASGSNLVKRNSSFHRRVGEQCPAFSDRKSFKSRRIPKPTPLQLHKVTKRSQSANTPDSLSLESPQQALDKIHEQLKNFEQPTGISTVSDGQRIMLLEDLEQEMGMQESHWQQMRQDMSRASLSTAVSSNPDSPALNIEPSPMKQSPSQAGPDTSSLAVPAHDNGRPRSSILYTADQVHISRVNLQPEKADSNVDDSPEEMDVPLVIVEQLQLEQAPTPAKQDGYRSQESSFSRQKPSQQSPETSFEVPSPDSALLVLPQPHLGNTDSPVSDNIMPESRKSLECLPTGSDSPSTKSPQKPSSSLKPVPSTWIGAKSPKVRLSSPQNKSRPQTLKPPRRSRRVSTLPDILENPEPLQNKRGTLGIFQFPWGEKSDNPSLPTALQTQTFMGMPFKILTGMQPMYPTLESQIQQVRSQQLKQSSFFDEDDVVDAMAQQDSSESDEDYDDDDSFDETTLWEIANLLKSDSVPSRNSLLPNYEEKNASQLSAIADDELASMPSPTGPEVDGGNSVPRAIKREASSPTLPSQPFLWEHHVCPKLANLGHGLSQPDLDIWHSYTLRASPPTTRLPPRMSVPDSITSTALWSLSSIINRVSREVSHPQPADSVPQLWSGSGLTKPAFHNTASGIKPSVPSSSGLALWSASIAIQPRRFGIPQPTKDTWSRYTIIDPDTQSQTRPKSRKQPTLTIETSALWSPNTMEPSPSYVPESPAMSSTMASPTTIARMSLAHSVEDSVRGMDETQTDPALQSSAVPDLPALYTSVATNEAQDSIVAPSTVGSDLWIPIAVLPVDDQDDDGLFGTRSRRHNSQRTPKSPAAKKTRPTPRTSSRPLSELQSSSLWRRPSQRPASYDWAMGSSIQTRPPTCLSVDSDTDDSSSADDCSSIHSSVVGESAPGSTSVDPDNLMPVFVSNADWMDTLSTTLPAQRPIDEIADSVPNWAAALHGSRPTSTASSTRYDDEDSNDDDFFYGRRTTQASGFDPARHHPVFNVYILDSSGAGCHPAATGYIYSLVNHNPDLIQR